MGTGTCARREAVLSDTLGFTEAEARVFRFGWVWAWGAIRTYWSVRGELAEGTQS